MKFSWKIAAPVLCLVVICGVAFSWKFYEKRKADELKLVEAAKVCRVSAEKGDAQAQYKLGYMYSHGQRVPQDYTEALRWYSKSADQGNAMGQSGLGYLYSHGEGVPQDYVKALGLYHKAADQGNAMAQYILGQIYYHGYGVPQDNVEAACWYRKAADQGYAYAQFNLGYMYSYGYVVQRDRAEAERWYHKAADQGDEYAQCALGMRIPFPNLYIKIFIIVEFFGGILLLFSFLTPRKNIGYQQQRFTTKIGIFVLLYVGFGLSGIFFIGIFRSVLAVDIFYFVKYLFGGILIIMLFSIVLPKRVWPKTSKIVLLISSIAFILFNILIIVLYSRSHNVRVFRFLSMWNGQLIGISISLITYLWRINHNFSDKQNADEDVTTLESAENEDESNQENEEHSHAD